MYSAIATLRGVSPYSQGQPFQSPRGDEETHEQREERCWLERAHWNKEGNLIIPSAQIKKAMENAASYRSIKVPGRGNATYTKKFKAGFLVTTPIVLPITRDTCQHEWRFVSGTGKPGGGKVWRKFPMVYDWEGTVEFIILDFEIGEKIFRMTLEDAGRFCGLGRYRPLQGGDYGRYEVLEMIWSEMAAA